MGEAVSEVSAELIVRLYHLFARSAPSERVQPVELTWSGDYSLQIMEQVEKEAISAPIQRQTV
jgi:hypothetical protein